MKKVTLKELTLINFKGHKERTIQFSDSTSISGRNGIGKSTIFDAFIWLLFGKDQFDRKDYEIIPTLEGQRLSKVDSEVLALLDIDGKSNEIRRVLHQKWVRRRGTAEEVFDGTETLYYVNSVPQKAGEYKGYIDSIIEESVFKLITNPAYFLSLHWEKQREILFKIAGSVSDHDIASARGDFAALLSELSGKSFADYKKELSARKKKLKDDLELIPSRIDQTQRLMPENVDFSALKLELIRIDAEIEKIDRQVENRSEAIREQYNAIQEKQKEINRLKLSQVDILNEKEKEDQKRMLAENHARSEKEQEITIINNKIKLAESDRDRLCDRLSQLKKDQDHIESTLERLRTEWDAENAKEFKIGTALCPLTGLECTDPAGLQTLTESNDRAKNSFMEAKEKAMSSISESGKHYNEKLTSVKIAIEDHNASIKLATDIVVQFNEDLEKIKNALSLMPIAQKKEIVAIELPEYVQIENQIQKIQSEIDSFKPVDNTDLIENKRELNKKRDDLKAQLSKKETIEKHREEIKVLELKGADLAQQIANLERTEFTMYEFEKVRIEESEKRVNRMFQIVRFKMFDRTNDGNEFTCCIATNLQGVPISATNTAEQVNAGLDIINVLCSFFNVSAPIFVDRSESVNDLIANPNHGQIISLVVTRQPELTISTL